MKSTKNKPGTPCGACAKLGTHNENDIIPDERRCRVNTTHRRTGLLGIVCLSLTLIGWAVGCASKTTAQNTSQSRNGIAEYRQMATLADEAVRRTLDSVATLESQSNQCSPEVLSRFSTEVQRLQVESVQVRAKSLAMQARGDAYFEQWHQNMARVKDPAIRANAEAHREQLHDCFRQIKALSQEGHESFKPFLSDLRQLRNALEKDPASIDATATRERIKDALEKGRQVEADVAGVGRQLDAMNAMLRPSEKTAEN